jgi:hypothetical protein
MAFGRISLVASQLMLAKDESSAGAVLFESGQHEGSSGLVMRSAFIGDARIRTINLKNDSITMFRIGTLGSNQFISHSGGSPGAGAWNTIFEFNFVTKSEAGKAIMIQTAFEGSIRATTADNPPIFFVRTLLNDTVEIIPSAQQQQPADMNAVPGPNTDYRIQRMAMGSLTATGVDQGINVKFQGRTSIVIPGTATMRVNAGFNGLCLVMKR